MPTAPAAAAGPATSPAAASGGTVNPFEVATNLYSEKIVSTSTQLGAATVPFFQPINYGSYLRGVRFLIRSSGATSGSNGSSLPTADNPANVIASLDLQNTDGAEILYPVPGYTHLMSQVYFRPWLQDPRLAYDYAQSINPSFSLFLQPEVRYGAATLSNTDARSQYKYNLVLNTATAVLGTGNGTAPTVQITSYMDAWAQPDATDLHNVSNQPVPAGLNLQMKRRHQPINLLPAGTDNIFQVNLTGNALRAILAIVRDNNGNRQDYLSDPIRWQLDNRNLGVFSPDMLFQWDDDFYSPYNRGPRPTGVYVFPRFFDVGNMTGQPWLMTTDATKLSWETTTLSTAVNVGNGSIVDWITDEVFPIGPIPSDLQEI